MASVVAQCIHPSLSLSLFILVLSLYLRHPLRDKQWQAAGSSSRSLFSLTPFAGIKIRINLVKTNETIDGARNTRKG